VIFKIDFEKVYDSVRWDFVGEVLNKKGFGTQLKEWIMSTVRGESVCQKSKLMVKTGRTSRHIEG
jgi:hypothetical protein